ncbi:polysaccharide deacetylase family protein [bacterium]|nr:polysaccharide deacetylase family protein [bacterium]
MPSKSFQPPAFVQVDVDGLWAVRRCYGQKEGDSFERDPAWQQGIPNLLDLFADHGVPASFFLVGRDLQLPAKRALARQIAGAGHEIANHSYTHRIGLTRLPVGAILEQITRTDRIIRAAGLPAPIGFRSPGYDVDARVLRVLRRLDYVYDASVLPTALGPVLRAADAWLARRIQPGKRQFGRLAYVRAPRAPYFPQPHRLRKKAASFADSRLMEFPVTTLPPFGLPLTGAAIVALGPERTIAALQRLATRRRPVLLLLHAIDLTDCTTPIIFRRRRPRTGGFNQSAEQKRAAIEPVLEFIARNYQVERARDFATRYAEL